MEERALTPAASVPADRTRPGPPTVTWTSDETTWQRTCSASVAGHRPAVEAPARYAAVLRILGRRERQDVGARDSYAGGMSKLEELAAEAMKLPPESRARLADLRRCPAPR